MPIASGVSNGARQTIPIAFTPTVGAFAISITNHPIPPESRVGYYYLFAYFPTTPFQSFLVDRGALYRPGLIRRLDPNYWASGLSTRMDVVWNVSNLNWTANFQ